MGYNVTAANNKYQYCNGTSWIDMTNTVSGSTCSFAGQLDYNTGSHVLYFCNGTNYVTVHAAGAGGAGCTAPTASEGALNYNTGAAKYQICAGTAWVNSPN